MTAAAGPNSRDAATPGEVQRLLHELQVHQVELEMQNEQLRQAQEELESARVRYFDLYDLAPVGYFTVSRQGRIMEANLTAALLLGVTREALASQPFSAFVCREDLDICHIRRLQLEEAGAQHSWELRMMRADGATFWANLQAALVQNGECRITLNDISERKRAEARIAQVDVRLRHLQKAESLERMAGSIAHHFNNKLQVVIGNLELASSDPDRGAGSDEFLRAAMLAALQAAEMSTTMLTYVGSKTASRESLDLVSTCRRIQTLLEDSLPLGLTLETDLPAPGLIVSAHAEQLQQLLINLVTNAGEAVGTGVGTVRLTVTTVCSAGIPSAHRVPIDWEPQNPAYACLEISDTGHGIAEKDVEKIFDPFFSDKFVGRGLGLAVVLGIVRAHDGAVAVQSEPGRGSTFRVFLPLSAEAGWEPAKQAPGFKAGGAVLLVEDEDQVRSLAAALLRELGFSVLETGAGAEALEILGRYPGEIRLVLCDLTMPGLDGWETLTALRKLVPGIPVILSSGHDRAQVMGGRHPELPQVFLRKPYRRSELAGAIRLALGDSAVGISTRKG